MYMRKIYFLCFRSVTDFPKFLGIAMETFLLMCDDKESDVRMAADECLNRTIKVTSLQLVSLSPSPPFHSEKYRHGCKT